MRHVVLASAVLFTATIGLAQYPQNPWQWQPQFTEKGFDLDRRLEQPVTIEIVGRSAIAALKLLSEQTGVSLSVAPENSATLGERRLTIIAKGCSLRAVMLGIPEALQECHWRIDQSGTQTAYQLHQNAGSDTTMAQLAEQASARKSEELRGIRVARVVAARRALKMSPEELTELEKTDPFLARSVLAPESRAILDLFFSLPETNMQQFLQTGYAPMAYADAPERFRQAVDRILQFRYDEFTAKGPVYKAAADLLFRSLLDNRSQLEIVYEDFGFDGSVDLRIRVPDKSSPRGGGDVEPVVWDQYPWAAPDFWYRPMLVATGTPDEKAADAFSQEWEKKGIVEKQRQREAKWIEPSDPALHRMLALPSEEIRGWEFLEVERTIAEQAGFSVVSDYFVSSSMLVPEEARAGMPLWRLLYTLREPSHYEWKQAGDCLVFHREDWYAQVPGQIPESLILAYRERLKKQGAFTLDDLATFAVALRGRPIPWDAVPADLQQAGIVGAAVFPTAFLLYASLTPEQQAKARSESGLSFPEMTRAQQESVRQRAAGFPTPVPVDDVPRTVFRVKESVAVRDSVRWLGCSLNLVFPDRPDETAVEIPLPLAAAKPGP